MLGSNGSWFDRFSLHSWDGYRGGGAAIATVALMLSLALVPRCFGAEWPLLIVIGLPAAF